MLSHCGENAQKNFGDTFYRTSYITSSVICTSLQTDIHASTLLLSFFAGQMPKLKAVLILVARMNANFFKNNFSICLFKT